MMALFVAGLLAALTALPAATASAQSLAAIASQSGKTAPAGKTYTNADLPADTTPAKTDAAPAPMPAGGEKPPTAAAPKGPAYEEIPGTGKLNVRVEAESNQAAQDEDFWRQGARNLRERIAAAEGDIALLAGRQDDDIGDDIAKRQQDVAALRKSLDAHLRRAKALNVPSEWVR